MRKVTRRIKDAWEKGIGLSVGNTRTDGVSVYLYDNKIIERVDKGVRWTLAGWDTMTTRERISGILGVGLRRRDSKALSGSREIEELKWYLVGVPEDYLLVADGNYSN